MPTLELEQLIQQELEMNPLLEIDEDENQDLEEAEAPEPESQADDPADDTPEAEAEVENEDTERLDELEFENGRFGQQRPV